MKGSCRLRTLQTSDLSHGWFNVGNLRTGFFSLVDFQRGTALVSVKSVDTTLGSSRYTRTASHIDDLALAN